MKHYYCWSRWELKEVIPSTPTLLPSSHPPVHPTFRSIWRPITCMPLVHLCLPPQIELSNAQTCDCVCKHSHTHTHTAYTLRRTVVYTFWSVEIDFLKARPEAVRWSTLSTYQGLHLFLNLAVKSLQMGKFLSNIPLDRPYEHNATARGHGPHVSLPNMARVWIYAWLRGQKGDGCSFAH